MYSHTAYQRHGHTHKINCQLEWGNACALTADVKYCSEGTSILTLYWTETCCLLPLGLDTFLLQFAGKSCHQTILQTILTAFMMPNGIIFLIPLPQYSESLGIPNEISHTLSTAKTTLLKLIVILVGSRAKA